MQIRFLNVKQCSQFLNVSHHFVYKLVAEKKIPFARVGRRIRKAVGTKKDAENALATIRADILRGEYKFKEDQKIIFEDFMEEYLGYSKVDKKPKSYTRDVSSSKHLLRHFGGMRLSKINAGHI